MPQQQRTCISCGKELPTGVTFCGFCGTRQTEIHPEPTPADFNTEAPTRIDSSDYPMAAERAARYAGTAAVQEEHSVLVDSALPDSADSPGSTEGISPDPGSAENLEPASEWKSPFWITVIFTLIVLPLPRFLFPWVLPYSGLLIVSLIEGVLYAAVIRKRCKLESRLEFFGTALSAAAAWFAVILFLYRGYL